MAVIAAYVVPHPPLIIPEVGKGQEKAVQTTIDSYHAIAKQIADIQPQTIILISPHSVLYSDYIHISPGKEATGNLKNFGAPAIYKTEYDELLVKEICRLCEKDDFPAGTLGEKNAPLDHGTLVPFYFINQYYTNYKLIRCSVSGLSRQEHYKFGMLVNEAAESLNRNAVVIASGDLSHKLNINGPYGFVPEGPELDKQLVDIMKSGNFIDFMFIDDNLCEKGSECGLNSFIIMSGMLNEKSVETEFYSYEGPFGVGYAVCAYKISGEDKSRDFMNQYTDKARRNTQDIRDKEDDYVRLARETLEYYVTVGNMPQLPENLNENLYNERAGVFVSIKKHGQLRGCIGTTEPTQINIAREIRQNAISSGTRDPRFPAVTKDELSELVYSVDVLSPASPCQKEDLDVKRYGVIVSSGYKRGLLLPNLEGVDTIEEQIDIARKKANIGAFEKYTLERFEVARHT